MRGGWGEEGVWEESGVESRGHAWRFLLLSRQGVCDGKA